MTSGESKALLAGLVIGLIIGVVAFSAAMDSVMKNRVTDSMEQREACEPVCAQRIAGFADQYQLDDTVCACEFTVAVELTGYPTLKPVVPNAP